MIYVKDLLTLQSLDRLKLLSGEEGLYRKVGWPNIAQTSSIKQWLVGGDVVIMTGIGLQITVDFMKGIVNECIDAKAACLIVFIHPNYIKEIQREVCLYAERYQFPIFEAPWDTKIALIFQDIFQLIAGDYYEDQMKNIFMEKIRTSAGIEPDGNIYQLLDKYQLTQKYTAVWITAEGGDTCAQAVSECCEMALTQGRIWYGRCMSVFQDTGVCFWIPGTNLASVKNATEQICQKLQEKFANLRICAGIGKNCGGLAGYAEAYNSAHTVSRMPSEKSVVAYHQLGIYQLLMEVPDQGLVKQYMVDKIGPLLNNKAGDELVRTLHMYLMQHEKSQETADKLFIHRNTLLKRLDKIRELLQIDMEDARTMHEIYNALDIYVAMCSGGRADENSSGLTCTEVGRRYNNK